MPIRSFNIKKENWDVLKEVEQGFRSREVNEALRKHFNIQEGDPAPSLPSTPKQTAYKKVVMT